MSDRTAAQSLKRPGALYRSGFRLLSSVHAFFYRRGIGRTMGPHQQLLLTTTGRKSGKPHTVALGALKEGEGWVVIASFGGADVDPNWWLNLVANPRATIQVNDAVLPVQMRAITDPQEYNRVWSMVVAQAPNYAGYQKKTVRKIPLGMLRPLT